MKANNTIMMERKTFDKIISEGILCEKKLQIAVEALEDIKTIKFLDSTVEMVVDEALANIKEAK